MECVLKTERPAFMGNGLNHMTCSVYIICQVFLACISKSGFINDLWEIMKVMDYKDMFFSMLYLFLLHSTLYLQMAYKNKWTVSYTESSYTVSISITHWHWYVNYSDHNLLYSVPCCLN